MNWNDYFMMHDEKPLDRLVGSYSNTAIFQTIGFIGDSLLAGEFESRSAQGNPEYHDDYVYSWGAYIGRKNGITARIFACGGMTAKWYIESFADANRFWDPANACQAYVIALGCNDLLVKRQEVGSIADICAEDYRKNNPTFLGCYAAIIARLKEIQPLARFFLVTLPNQGTEDTNDELRKAHQKTMYDLAEYYNNTYVIDLYRYGPVYDEAFRKRFWLYGHMNASGYVFTAQIIDSYIDYLIRKKPEDFRTVPYIGTNWNKTTHE